MKIKKSEIGTYSLLSWIKTVETNNKILDNTHTKQQDKLMNDTWNEKKKQIERIKKLKNWKNKNRKVKRISQATFLVNKPHISII